MSKRSHNTDNSEFSLPAGFQPTIQPYYPTHIPVMGANYPLTFPNIEVEKPKPTRETKREYKLTYNLIVELDYLFVLQMMILAYGVAVLLAAVGSSCRSI